jgi:serine/threonine protein kinase
MVDLPPHPNIVQMYGVSLDGPQAVIVLEYCAGGSLDEVLFENEDTISEDEMISLARGIARGVYHLHKYNIIHRDLAARNVLLTSSGEPKISVFDLASSQSRTFAC